MKVNKWQTVWVEDMPNKMENGRIYVSIKHRLTEHLCACGCGAEVSLPLGPSEWKFEYNGDTVSLWPSIGNWRLPCRSHYVISENKTRWREQWSEERILAGRKRDRDEKLRDVIAKNRRETWLTRIGSVFGSRGR